MKKILLTSASKVFLKRNSNLLMRRGFQLITTMSGAEALKLCKENLIDLILSDFELADMSGCTLCSLVRADEKVRHVPVVLFCHNIPGSIERVEQSGASAMILKPVDPMQLLETISSYIDLQIGRNKRVVLKVSVLSKKQDLEFICFSHDISNTGILLETDYQLALGSRIICQFTLPDSCPMKIEGEIIRCMSALECENLYGVKFIDIPLSFRREIDNYVASIASSTAGAKTITAH